MFYQFGDPLAAEGQKTPAPGAAPPAADTNQQQSALSGELYPFFHAGSSVTTRSADFPARDQALEENFFAELYLERGEHSSLALLLESRRLPGAIFLGPGRQDSGERRTFASGELRSPWLYLAAGRRYLPGPRHSFLAHPGLSSILEDLPTGRKTGSVFVHTPFLPYTPGLFGLEDIPGAGLYLTDPGERYFLAYHPGAQLGQFSGRSGRATRDGRLNWIWDLSHNPRTTEGFARLHLLPEAGPAPGATAARGDLEFLLEGERREAWDYRDFGADELFENRRGKSGLGFTRLRYKLLTLTGAGQDIGADGMRLLRVKGALPLEMLAGKSNKAKHIDSGAPGLAGGRIEVDLGVYRRRHYGADRAAEYRDRALGLGWSFRSQNYFFALRGERRQSGIILGEVAAGMRAGRYRFEFAGIARGPLPRNALRDALLFDQSPPTPTNETNETDESSRATTRERPNARNALGTSNAPGAHSIEQELEQEIAARLVGEYRGNRVDRAFLFQKNNEDNETGARFFREQSGVLRLRLSGPALYFLLDSRISDGRPRFFGRLQFKVPF